ncbi:hypothetical protein BY458DRAFT_545816 [Sporodiniella umbellata]|nr:hypothetical protein BY458DRAFT_545816 [Sporodiniella umbellata]
MPTMSALKMELVISIVVPFEISETVPIFLIVFLLRRFSAISIQSGTLVFRLFLFSELLLLWESIQLVRIAYSSFYRVMCNINPSLQETTQEYRFICVPFKNLERKEAKKQKFFDIIGWIR